MKKPQLVKLTCEFCGKQFERPTRNIHWARQTNSNHFCDKSCAASYNNKKYPKRVKKQHPCKACGVMITGRNTYCPGCYDPYTLAKATKASVAYGNQEYANRYARIRDQARRLYIKPGVKCERCGWDKHVEVCHIKPITKWDEDALVSDINGRKNIKLLCPNCHWLYDHSK